MRAAPPLRCVRHQGVGVSPYGKGGDRRAVRLHRCQFSRRAVNRGREEISRSSRLPRGGERPEWGPSPAAVAAAGPRPGRSSAKKREIRIFLIPQTLKIAASGG